MEPEKPFDQVIREGDKLGEQVYENAFHLCERMSALLEKHPNDHKIQEMKKQADMVLFGIDSGQNFANRLIAGEFKKPGEAQAELDRLKARFL
jgi:hypothetical protein